MAKSTNLRVWQQARDLLKQISAITADMPAEGDLKSQLRRAAISVVSNISEGCERGSDREFRRFLTIANASATVASGATPGVRFVELLRHRAPSLFAPRRSVSVS